MASRRPACRPRRSRSTRPTTPPCETWWRRRIGRQLRRRRAGPLSPRGASLHTRRREQALWEADQLRHSQRAGDVLARFSEGQYSFPPTFKVLRQRGAHYKQQRIPSYCDRILWRSMPGRGSSAVTQTSLAAVPGALPPARTLAPAAKPRQCRCCEQASPPRTTSPSSPLSRWPPRRGCTAPPAPESRRGEGSCFTVSGDSFRRRRLEPRAARGAARGALRCLPLCPLCDPSAVTATLGDRNHVRPARLPLRARHHPRRPERPQRPVRPTPPPHTPCGGARPGRLVEVLARRYIAFFTNPPGLLGGSVPTSSVKKSVLATGAPGAGEGGQQGAREPNSSTHSTRDRRDRRGEGVARRDGRLGARPVGWLRGRGRRRYVQLVRGGAASAALLVLARRLAACHAHPGCLRPRHRLEGRPARR